VRLENRVNLFRLELSSIVKRVKGISKGMLADRTEVTLAPLAGVPMFVGLIITTESTAHGFRIRLIFLSCMIGCPTSVLHDPC